MKVLHISNKPIFPLVDGGCVAMKNFIDVLQKANFEIKHLCIGTNKHPFVLSNYPEDYAFSLKPESVAINTDINGFQAFIHLFKQHSYNVSRFDSEKMHELITKCLKEAEYDIILFDSLYTLPYIETVRSCTKAKLLYRAHNVEYRIWEDLASNESSGFKSWYLSKLAKDLKRCETERLPLTDGILSISEDDTKLLEELSGTTPIHHLPVSIAVASEQSDLVPNRIFHIGGMDWKPNIEAVNRLIEITRIVKASNPNLELHLAGKGTKEKFGSIKENDVISHDFVSDLTEFIKKHGILVTPIDSGSGIRIKILEAMAQGIPVLTTSKGAQGIDYSTNCLIIADENTDFAAKIDQLINDTDFAKEIGGNALNYMRKNHNIETTSKELIGFINRK